MKSEVILTADGSRTLFIPGLNESYHSRNGALTESMHIFINAGYHYVSAGKDSLNILEVGLGTGLNALLTLIEAERDKKHINYLGVEPNRVESDKLEQLGYPELHSMPKAQDYFNKIHKTSSAEHITNNFTLTICSDKFEDINLDNSFFDLVYFDAFAPAVCPELWQPDIFLKISAFMKTGGVLVTYSCKGDVRRALQAAGLKVEKLPGPPGKREFLRTVKV